MFSKDDLSNPIRIKYISNINVSRTRLLVFDFDV